MKSNHCFLLLFACLFPFLGCNTEQNQGPNVNFLHPAFIPELLRDTIIPIEIQATDLDGEIEKVVVLVNDSPLANFTSPPYTFDWQVKVELNHGNLTLKTIAFDNNSFVGMDTLLVSVPDFRNQYLGEYEFEVRSEKYLFNTYHTFDTSYAAGEIRLFVAEDSKHDYFYEDDSQENPANKISIEIGDKIFITPKVNTSGEIISKHGYHYLHSGAFFDNDSIRFTMYCCGSPAAQNMYWVIGKKK